MTVVLGGAGRECEWWSKLDVGYCQDPNFCFEK